ncbi:hypothetical protein CDG77_03840 [Nostoc sp. 'Peltigera membranacea cyanobiont' 213]|uniref:hypothetical protein n=1 Tax=Nostoc cyanobionts TaxID=3123326 RepID=UPI000B9599D2|nr:MULTISPECIES: hypothetical protein [unclassified Nostoc]AVH66720.1 hypothetical protein NPM_5269 [Nostoc sp. 'Peltigera membranacea cyanobiont' N6]OYD98791.1 hypothetical protein CDG77_03840 [Nostoc sp. 'Peltigera membranacea cyanobiont' 213]
MAKNHLDILYSEVFNYVYPDIKDLPFGVLKKVLFIILETEHQKFENICNTFGITESGSKDDDEEIIDSFIGKTARAMSNPISIFDAHKREIFWIVVVACLLVGAIGCIQFIHRRRNQVKAGNIRNVQQPVAVPLEPLAPPVQAITVALCLVVPAYVAQNLKEQSPINVDEIEKLIDNTSYFLCAKVADTELVQQRLDLTDENILSVSERREVYVRIHIADGQEMLDKTVPYILKRNLPSHGQGVVKKLASLGDLSGLEAFNRI